MAIGGVVINFAVKATDAIKDLDVLTRSVQNVGDSSRVTDSRVGKFRRTLKVGLAGAAAAAGGALVGAGAALVSFGQDALADAVAAGKLADTLKRIPGITDDAVESTEAWIESMRIATGVSKDELRQGVADLTIATGDLQEAQELSALAWDVAVGTGKGYEEILDALVEATKGETGALTEQVQWLKTADGRTLTLKDAVKKLERAYGGAAEAASDRDPFERLKRIWGELKEALGRSLLPLIERFSDWFKSPKNKEAVQKLIDQMGDLAYQAGQEVVPAIKGFLKYVSSDKFREDLKTFKGLVEALWNAFKLVYNAVSEVIGILKTLWGWLEKANESWNRLLDKVDRGITWPWEKNRGPGSGGGVFGSPAALTGPASAGFGRMFTGPITLNVTGAGDPIATARAIKRALETYDGTQGRTPGARLAVAW